MSKRLKQAWESFSSIFESWGMSKSTTVAGQPPRSLHLLLPLPDGQRLLVGVLSQSGGQFTFQYSDDFKNRSDLPPIASFPDKGHVYESDTLWPFFQVRIPPTDRPDVDRVIKERHLDPRDTFALLRELGGRSISTPYEFAPG